MAVHDELITALKFDNKFKNSLRDYYSYGFKTFKDYEEKSARETAKADWDRLNRILFDHDYLEWADASSKILFITADSQAMLENPFHGVYLFCDTKYTDFFLAVFAALSEKFHPTFLKKDFLRRLIGVSGLPSNDKLDLEVYLDDEDNPDEFISYMEEVCDNPEAPLKEGSEQYDKRKREFTKLQLAVESQICTDGLKTSELLFSEYGNNNALINGRLKNLEPCGIIICEQKQGASGGHGDRHYRFSNLTLKKLIAAGSEVNADFELHLRTALDFYSRYYPLGEAGYYIQNRMNDDYVSPFRFKHEYFMQALNDFNLIDIITAIEEGEWCRIVWKREDRGQAKETLAFPLEVRVSSSTGRETLIYYDVLERSLQALRLEFIDEIYVYSDSEIRKALSSPEINLSSTEIDEDISKARDRIKNLWGTALTPGRQQNLLKDQPMNRVRLVLSIDSRSEAHVRTRLLRECRTGEVTVSDDGCTLYFEAGVCDTTDIRSWIRSFYSRIVSCEGMGTEDFSPITDVEDMLSAIDTPSLDEGDIPLIFNIDGSGTEMQSGAIKAPERADVCALVGKGKKARAHESIFHEIFSVYTAISADTFVRLANNTDSSESPSTFTFAELDKAINDSIERYRPSMGKETEEILPERIKSWVFSEDISEKIASDKYRLRYHCDEDVDFYKDIIPLTIFEQRWLKTILDDDKIGYFLTQNEITAIRAFLDSGECQLKAFPMDKIVAFDRFYSLEYDSERDHENLRDLLIGIREDKKVCIRYRTNRGKIIAGRFAPVVLEYSKRNDRFQVYLLSDKDNRIYAMNVSQLEEINITEIGFDREKAGSSMEEARKKDMRSVEIRFYNTRRMTDRILTEFSPWQKRCVYNKETGIYTLTIYYQKQDETELVTRLMGYGPHIRFKDRDHSICREIKKRLDRQRERFRENVPEREYEER